MNTAPLYSTLQIDNARLLADSCTWAPPERLDRPTPLAIYPQHRHMPEDPTWTQPVHAFLGAA